jgi:hypothetical protein
MFNLIATHNMEEFDKLAKAAQRYVKNAGMKKRAT